MKNCRISKEKSEYDKILYNRVHRSIIKDFHFTSKKCSIPLSYRTKNTIGLKNKYGFSRYNNGLSGIKNYRDWFEYKYDKKKLINNSYKIFKLSNVQYM